LAILVDFPPEGKEWIHEIKFDGHRLQSHIKDAKVKIFTRSGIEQSEHFPTLVKAFSDLKIESAIFDGEVVVVDQKGRSHFSSLQKALSLKDYTNIRIYLFIPELPVCTGIYETLRAFMPKTTINKDGQFLFCKYYIRFPG
jgi:bifunctional non-homologous end joining protein LigD